MLLNIILIGGKVEESSLPPLDLLLGYWRCIQSSACAVSELNCALTLDAVDHVSQSYRAGERVMTERDKEAKIYKCMQRAAYRPL